MMPSRGVNVLRGIAPRLRQCQHRNYSSMRTSISSSLDTSSLRAVRTRRHQLAAGLASTTFQLSRNASTATNTPPSSTLSGPASSSSSVSDLDSLKLDDIDFTANAAAAGLKKIGYLKELGVDYGWGITSTIQWFIEHCHIWAGMPWWASIATTAVLVRIVTLPLAVKASDTAARATAMNTVLTPMQNRMKQYQREGNSEMVQVEMRNWMAARSAAGISFSTMLMPPVIQAIIGYCGFRLMNKMTSIPVPGLKDGGFLWLTDLTVPDGYLILPGIMAVSMHLLFRLGSETGASQQLAGGMRTFMLWGMPGIIFVITGWQPGALCVWFTASGALSMATGLALKRPAVRRVLGITPLYDTSAPKVFNVPTGQAATAASVAATSSTPSSSTVSSTSSSASPPRPSYMRPTYQAPNLRTSGHDRNTIDTTLAKSSSSDAPPEPAVKKGLFDGFRATMKNAKESAQRYNQQQAEKKQKKSRDAAIERAVEERRNKHQS